jgi:hypothetical protein
MELYGVGYGYACGVRSHQNPNRIRNSRNLKDTTVQKSQAIVTAVTKSIIYFLDGKIANTGKLCIIHAPENA